MLTQLSTVKTRLAIDAFDPQFDSLLLTAALTAISFRFDKETNRTLARTVNLTPKLLAPNTPTCFVKPMRTETLATTSGRKPKSSPPDAPGLFALILGLPISAQNCPKTRPISCYQGETACELYRSA